MSRYPPEYPVRHATQGHAGNTDVFGTSLKSSGRDNRDSKSPSDDGSAYIHYSKCENELEEDPNASLIAQTLNTDGTPKRPMNAFMIFARRRRPQVSAENQSMRTGEISKILSKEWNAMDLKDKQFYLDQAKQLKDIFNSKYPDYVYKRRPNNSRKKRGMGGSGNRALDSALGVDIGGDELLDDVYPVDLDGEDILADMIAADLRYAQMPANVPSTRNMHSRSPSYSYPSSDTSYRQIHGRAPYPPAGPQRGAPDASLELSQNMSSTPHYQQSYLQAHQSHSQPSAGYASEHGTWDSARAVSGSDQTRTASAGWLDVQARMLASHPHDRSHTYPPSNGQSPWGRATTPAPLKSTSASSQNYAFPTLNSPFYPSQSPISGDFSSATSTGSSLPNSAPAYLPSSSSHSQENSRTERPSSRYGHRSYGPSSSPTNQYPSATNRDLRTYQHQHLSAQSMASIQIPHIHTSSASSSGSGTPNFWLGANSRDVR